MKVTGFYGGYKYTQVTSIVRGFLSVLSDRSRKHSIIIGDMALWLKSWLEKNQESCNSGECN